MFYIIFFWKFCSMEKHKKQKTAGRKVFFLLFFIFCQAGTENVLMFKQFHLFIYGIFLFASTVGMWVCVCVYVYVGVFNALVCFLDIFPSFKTIKRRHKEHCVLLILWINTQQSKCGTFYCCDVCAKSMLLIFHSLASIRIYVMLFFGGIFIFR